IAVIVTGQASAGAAAQARARDEHGQPHYVMIEPDEAGEVFAEGQSVIIVRRAGAKFFAVSDETAALHNARSAIPIENRGT
ncbi:MAG TPA: OB-fold-containig protein, partial [Phenylobacterium sp.]